MLGERKTFPTTAKMPADTIRAAGKKRYSWSLTIIQREHPPES
ncbi:hypothetical protein BOTU111921_23200 [Bordetella tumbae]